MTGELNAVNDLNDRRRRSVGWVGVVIGVVIAASGIAYADAHAGCANGRFCAYDNDTWGGAMIWEVAADPSWQGDGFDNRMESAEDLTGNAWRVFDGVNFSGVHTCYPALMHRDTPAWFDNQGSSATPAPGAC